VVKESAATDQARRALGAELAAFRDAAGYNQAEFARLTSCSRSTIANVETGRQRVPRKFWESAEAALRTGGVLASGHDDIEAAPRSERHAMARRTNAARHVRAWQQHLESPPDPDIYTEQAGTPHSLSPWPTWPAAFIAGVAVH
jgi:transcriptional regulator with XRE-family HTH domain